MLMLCVATYSQSLTTQSSFYLGTGNWRVSKKGLEMWAIGTVLSLGTKQLVPQQCGHLPSKSITENVLLY